MMGGWLAVLAGAWFVVGPSVSLTWESGPGPIGRPLFGSTRQMIELVGYFYGLGALIVAFGAYAIGRFAPGPRLAEQTAPAALAPRERVSEAPPRPAASEGQGRRRFPLSRR